MKREERIAQEYLVAQNIGPLVYEPEKNCPPDFLVDGEIAVEVRRLNQNETTESGTFRGLEETWIPFNMRFRRLLASFGPPTAGRSWFVSYSFRRPLGPWCEIRPLLKWQLTQFQKDPCERRLSVRVSNTLEIDFFPASKVHPTFFLWGAGSDGDSGGFIVQEMLKNLRLCVEEKTIKVAPHRHKYGEWWLIFVDLIGWGLEDYDRAQLKEHWKMDHDWDKIILVNPFKPTSAFDLNP